MMRWWEAAAAAVGVVLLAAALFWPAPTVDPAPSTLTVCAATTPAGIGR